MSQSQQKERGMTKQRRVPMVERMSLWQRVVHGILILAILMLVV